MKAYYLLFVINLLLGEVLFTDITNVREYPFQVYSSEGMCF